jgi:hypothetical protein
VSLSVALVIVLAVIVTLALRTRQIPLSGLPFVFVLMVLCVYAVGVEYARRVQAIQSAVQTLAVHTQSLAASSAVWGEVAKDLKAAHTDFLSAVTEAGRAHQATQERLFTQHEQALRTTLETLDRAERERADRQDARIDQLQTDLVTFVTQMIAQERDHFTAQIPIQEAASQRIVEEALQQFGGVVEMRVTSIESHVGAALERVQQALPEAVRAGVAEAVGEAVELANQVREQAGVLTHAVSQVSQNADRQLRAYEQWAVQAQDWQLRLEKSLESGQQAQREVVAQWQAHAQTSLNAIASSLSQATETAQGGNTLFLTALREMVECLRVLEKAAETLRLQAAQIQAPVQALGAVLVTLRQPLEATSRSIETLQRSVGALNQALNAREKDARHGS